MQIISCPNGEEHLEKYAELTAHLYREHPAYADDKIQRDAFAFSGKNPFFRHGSIKNFMAMEGGKPVAHASAIIDSRLPETAGLIGYFECDKNPGIAGKILDRAAGYLAGLGRKRVQGPVQCTTWQGYGFSCSRRDRPYFMEPFSRDYYCDLFEESGFTVKQKSVTSILGVEQTKFGEYAAAKRKLVQGGFRFESVNGERISSHLDEVYFLVSAVFVDTFAFVRISIEEFRIHFGTLAARFPECILLLSRSPEGKAVGFLWGLPDRYAPDGGRLVLKVIGVAEQYRGLGIGKALFHSAYRFAQDRRFREFILSTMRSDNMCVRHLTSGTDASFREYKAYEIGL